MINQHDETDQQEADDATEVAIVGAGPVGLLLAADLASHGVQVVVLERAATPDPLPKANGIVGQTAIELSKRGILDGTGFRVVSPPRFQFGPLELKLGFGPRNPLHILPIPQRRLEEILEHRGRTQGAHVRRGHEAVGLSQSDSNVTLNVRAGHSTRSVVTQYLVGCDGAHSLIRKQAGIGFPGFTNDSISLIARLTIPANRIVRTEEGLDIAGVGLLTTMRPNQLAGGSFSIAPAAALDREAPDDLYIVSTQEPRGDSEPSDAVSVEGLRASLSRVLGADLPFVRATAIRSTVANSRQADAYRHGRVFLAGDAAHLFNAGGSSLNIGLQDALRLAGVLTAVLREGAPAAVLDDYEAERHPAGQRALQQTRVQALLSGTDDKSTALREVLGKVAAERGAARRLAQLIEDA